jgi:WD40 repeat protein
LTVAGTRFYKSGGTLAPDEPSYVSRHADEELHQHLCDGQFCYVLTSRQMGKSSLMNKVATRLHREGVVAAEIDLTTIGQNLTIEQWYDGLVYEIGRRVNLKAQMRACWQANAHLGPLQRFITILRDVVLTTFFQPVIIFVDEIEVVRSLPFRADEFFAAIRECYNRRASDPEMRRLTFCLLGMATPQDLIQDPRITPFNIGKRIELTDFTFDEAKPLSSGMCDGGRDGERLLRRVLYWTSGQPYLTQRLCQAVAEDASVSNELGVDRLCRKLFLSEQARESEPNLVPLREYVLRSAPDRAGILDMYQKVLAGKKVANDANDINVTILQLAGITRARAGDLRVRNRIYESVFDRRWIRANMPDAELRRQRAAFRRAFAINAGIFGSISLIAIIAAFIAYGEYHVARGQQQKTSRLLYVADSNLAEQALESHNVEQVRNILKAHVGDEMDGFEYGYFWRMSDVSVYTCPGPTHEFMCGVSFSPDGRYLACASPSGSVQIVDTGLRQVIQTFNGVSTPYTDVAFAPGGRYLAAISNNAICIWDTRTWAKRRIPVTANGLVTSLAFDKTGNRLAVGTSGSRVFIYDVESWRVSRQLGGAGNTVYALQFSPTGLLATAGSDSTIRIWDSPSGRLVSQLRGHTAPVRALAFSPDGRTLAASSEDRTISLWNTKSWMREHTIYAGDETIYGLAFSSATGELATGGSRNAVELWDPRTQTLTRVLNGHTAKISDIACSPNGRWLATASWDGTAKIWDLKSQRPITIPRIAGSTYNYALSLDGQYAAGMLTKNAIGVWDTTTGKELTEVQIGSHVAAISMSSNRDLLAVADQDQISIIDWNANRQLWNFEGPLSKLGVSSIALSPDGATIAVGSTTGEIDISRYPGKVVRHLRELQGGPITSMAFSSDGNYLAVGSHDASISIYDLNSNRRLATLLGHHADVVALAFAGSGRELVSGSADSTIKVWNIAAEREVLTLPTRWMPMSLALDDNDRRLEAVDWNGQLHSWESASADEVAAALANNR